MSVYSLTYEDFAEKEYILLGIRSALEDYRLAFFINKELSIFMKRCKDDVIKNKKSIFSLYAYYDDKTEEQWYLVANKYKKIELSNSQLFPKAESVDYLIPEQKKTDYFVKIEGNKSSKKALKIVKSLNLIPNIITSYSINPITLKSKHLLIF